MANGQLVLDGGVARPIGDLAELSVPATLQALIASRLDGLEAQDRALLQAASVIGKTFAVDALAAVSGMPSGEVDTHLRGLVRREMLSMEANPRSPEQGQYGFVQGLVREVAYGTLALRDRRRLHLAAARHFETRDDDGMAAALAEHYLSAYRAQPEGAEGHALAAQARVALRGAAERARSLGSFAQAFRFLERALEVTTDPDERRQLHAAASDAGLFAGFLQEPVTHAEHALELAREGDDRRRIVEALGAYALALGAAGHATEARAVLEPAREEYRDLAETPEYVRLVAQLARSTMLQGRSDDAVPMIDELLPVAERLQLSRDTIDMLVTRGACLASIGRLREAVATLAGAKASAESYGLTDVGLRARVNLSYAAAAEDPQMAFEVTRDGVAMVKRLGMQGYGGYMLGNAASFAIDIGEWDWAIAELEEWVTRADYDFYTRACLAHLRGLRGEDVEDEFRDIDERTAGLTEAQIQPTVDHAHAAVELARGNLDRALELARRSYGAVTAPDNSAPLIAARAAAWKGDVPALRDAIERLGQLPHRVPTIGLREAEAAAAALEGRRAEAATGFADAIRRWREIGVAVGAAWCALDWVMMLGTSDASARAAADEARAVFERVGARPLLDLLAEAVARGMTSPAATAAAPDGARVLAAGATFSSRSA
jgi:tetratricopeptide (TPR) repeat protein